MLAEIRIKEDGTIFYLSEKQGFHRLSGPAIIDGRNGTKKWLINGKRHRLDGPAVEYADGSKEWFINGIEYTEREFNEYVGGLC